MDEGLADALAVTDWPHFLHLIDLPAMLSGRLNELRHLGQTRERAMRFDSKSRPIEGAGGARAIRT